MITIINVKELLAYPQLEYQIPIVPNVKLKGVACSASKVESVLEELRSRKEELIVLLYIV